MIRVRRGGVVAVVGLGGVGSQVARYLAGRASDVIGFDAHRPPHELGSSHGESRVIREAYFEGPQYVDLVRRAFTLWEAQQRDTERRLLTMTGGVHVGLVGGRFLRGIAAAASEHRIPLGPLEAADRGVFAPPPGTVAVREERAGWLAPEVAVESALRLAARDGAELRFDEPVLSLDRTGARCRLTTRRGTYAADRVVVCAGAWLGHLVPELAPHLAIERQVLLWFDPLAHSPTSVWLYEHAPDRYVYGFPPDRHGLKIALHHDGRVVDPDRVDRVVGGADVAAVRAAVSSLFPVALGAVRRSLVCLYTNTPDEHFALGLLPADERVVVASACSGHGFKFAPATGEAAGALALADEPPVDISPFSLERLSKPTQAPAS